MSGLLSHFRFSQSKIFAVAFTVFAIGITVFLSPFASNAGAAGAGGSGGTGSGGSGAGYSFQYKYGWYVFDTAGSGPAGGFRNGYTWGAAQAQCNGIGANKIIGFVYHNAAGSQKIYTWVGENNPANIKTGPGYISTGQAYAYYLEMGPLPGLTWGSSSNGVGWFCYDDSSEWSVSGSSTIQAGGSPNPGASVGGTVTAAPGMPLYWFHSLRNNGPDAMDRQIYYNVGKSGFSNGWDGIVDPQGWASGGPGSTFVTHYASGGAAYATYGVTQNDVGNTLCQGIRWTDLAWNNPTDGAAGPACAYIPFNYILTPEIVSPANGSMVESALGAVPVTGRVTNSGGTKSHTNIQWQVTQVKYAPGVAIANLAGGVNPNIPCNYFTGNQTCAVLQSGTEASGYGANATISYATAGNLGDEPVGTRLCFAMSIKRNSSSNADWRHSSLHCLVVGKKPKIQVYGGDLIVGRGYTATGTKISANVTTSTTNKGGTYYGSWSEYAIIPSGTLLGMASASGYASAVTNNDLCNATTPLNLLSFSNAKKPASPPASASAPAVCNNTAIGSYSLTSASQFDAIAARLAPVAGAPTLTGNVNVTTLTSKTVYNGSGTINLSASAPITPGKWVVINAPNADVRITSNIQYTPATLNAVSDIPQLVIIARNIVIADTVSNVDSWLYAKGTGVNGSITTCDSAAVEPAGLTSNVCNTKLTVNGPVVANHLYLYRTAGSDTGAASGAPAEVFNLRPDAYMWASSFSGVGTKARTVMTTELPPRF